MLILVIIIAGFGLFFAVAKYLEKKRNQAFVAFCTKYGFQYQPKVQDSNYGGLVKGKVSNRAFGVDKATNKTVELFYLTHKQHTGTATYSSSRTKEVFRRTVVTISLKNTNNSHIFLDSKVSQNNPSDAVSLSSERRYTAEGHFGEFFNLYFPEGDHVTVLSIFAPDVMSLIVGYYGEYDIEIVNNTLYLYQYSQQDSLEAFEKLYQAAYALAHAIDDNAPQKLPQSSAMSAVGASNNASGSSNMNGAKKDITQSLGQNKPLAVAVVLLIVGGMFYVSMTGMLDSGASNINLYVTLAFIPIVIVGVVVNVRRNMKYQQIRKQYQIQVQKSSQVSDPSHNQVLNDNTLNK